MLPTPRFSGPVAGHSAASSAWSERRDSNPLRPALQAGASTASASPTWHTREESNLESRLWRPLPSPSGRVCGAPGRIRTYTDPILSRVPLPIGLRTQTGTRREIRTLKHLFLRQGAIPIRLPWHVGRPCALFRIAGVPQSQNVKELAESKPLERLCPLRVRLLSKQVGRPTAHTLQGLNYQLSREEL